MKANNEAKRCLLDARREADAILATGANRLLLIEAILIVCVFVSLFISLQSATVLLLSTFPEDGVLTSLLSYLPTVICVALIILLAAPVVLGLFRLAQQMQTGEEPILMDLFYFLSSRERYLQGLYFTRFASLKVALMILAVDTVNILWSTQIPDTPAFRVLGGVLIALVIVVCIIWMLFPYSKLNSLLRNDDEPARVHGGIRLVWFFLPWLLWGFVSIGILLVIDVLPRMLLTYFCDCNRNLNSH